MGGTYEERMDPVAAMPLPAGSGSRGGGKATKGKGGNGGRGGRKATPIRKTPRTPVRTPGKTLQRSARLKPKNTVVLDLSDLDEDDDDDVPLVDEVPTDEDEDHFGRDGGDENWRSKREIRDQ